MLDQGEVAMRPVRIITAVIFATAVAITGCTTHSTTTDPSAAPAPQLAPTDPAVPTSPSSHHRTQTDKATPTAPAAPRQLHFATPQAAMRYLAAAYNRNDLAALKHVTTPPRAQFVLIHDRGRVEAGSRWPRCLAVVSS
jgi:hypothetical protein